ncbi:MAG: hypothetical protein WBD22_11760 [Pyrinomonadaceae bacterium]
MQLLYKTKTKRLIGLMVVFALISVTTPVALANGNYEVELAVPQGKKSVETDAVLTFADKTFSVTPDKAIFKSSAMEFSYLDLKSADYSFAKKPMLSGGGAVATAILLGLFALPFLFIKKKKHWITVQTEKEFAVIKLGDNNHRQIIAEFETHGVKVNTVLEDKK